ncbi:MAG: hypothetical protein HQ508_00705 [Candidatus Marinimicrobia bacterium]|nr:hypothetical protein [Candidatus Neomarinimicrobiota bacterium]
MTTLSRASLSAIILTFSFAGVSSADQGITPSSLYDSFNLRSINSSIGPRLRAYCGDTLSEIQERGWFGQAEVSMTNNGLSIETSEWHYSIKIVSESGQPAIEFTDNSKAGTYQHQATYSLEFDQRSGHWVAIGKERRLWKTNISWFTEIDSADWIKSDCEL